MSYLRHWKLNRSPFTLTGHLGRIFTGGTVEEALARAEFLIDQRKQFGLIIGPSGVGKSVLMDHLSKSRTAKNPRERIVRLDLGFADTASFPIRLANALGLTGEIGARQDSWDAIQDYLFSAAALGHHMVLLVDDAAESSDEVLHILFKMWGEFAKASTLMSVDDESMVNLPRWILDQCELKIELTRWDLGQTADYFEFALAKAGGRDDLFDGQSITRIQELSDGIPRKINQIADLTLVAGAVRKADRVTAELVDQVCDEFTVSVGQKFPLFWEEQQLNAG